MSDRTLLRVSRRVLSRSVFRAQVTIYERDGQAGGLSSFEIPQYRCHYDGARFEIRLCQDLGIKSAAARAASARINRSTGVRCTVEMNAQTVGTLSCTSHVTPNCFKSTGHPLTMPAGEVPVQHRARAGRLAGAAAQGPRRGLPGLRHAQAPEPTPC